MSGGEVVAMLGIGAYIVLQLVSAKREREWQSSAEDRYRALATIRCDHTGIGLPGCDLCDPRGK